MANISIKKDFADGEKLFAQQLNNNFDTIEKGVNAGNKIIWKDDNGAEIQSFRGTTAEVAERPIIDGQTLYNIETGETALDYGNKRISTGAGNVVYIGDEEPTNEATKIWISNDNMEGLGSEVAIGPEEPTTGEELWIQRGKNLINPLVLLDNFDLPGNGTAVPSDSWFITPFIEVNENTSYYMSGFKNGSDKEIQYKEFYDKNFNFISQNRDNPVAIPSGVKYVRIAGSLQYKESLLFIQSDVAVDYEPYITKKIHTKTDKGYEEFYNEENITELQNNFSNLINKTTLKSETVIAATFFKIVNLVIVQGWFTINGTTAEFTLPYKPSVRTWASSTGMNTESKPSYLGMMELSTTGRLTAKYTGASTYGTTGFCYFTND